jgi:hypothetical protein
MSAKQVRQSARFWPVRTCHVFPPGRRALDRAGAVLHCGGVPHAHGFCNALERVAAAGMGNKVLQFHDGWGDPLETVRAITMLGRIGRDLGLRGVTVTELAQCTHVPSRSKCCHNNAWVNG